MPLEYLLIFFVGVTALAIVLEAMTVRKTLRSTNEAVARVSSMSTDLEKEARELLGQLQQVVAGLDHLRTAFENLGQRTTEVNAMLEGRARDLDELVGDLITVSSRQAEKVDEVVSDTVIKFRQTTDMIQQDILRPVVEIASIIRGLRTGLGYLFSKRSSQAAAPPSSDEGMFIG